MTQLVIYVLGFVLTWPVAARELAIAHKREFPLMTWDFGDSMFAVGIGFGIAFLWPLAAPLWIIARFAHPALRSAVRRGEDGGSGA